MDYDKIVEGRRRNWEALKPEEIREREREEAKDQRHAELEKKEKEGGRTPEALDRMRRLRQDPESESDRAQFRNTLRLSTFLVVAFVGAMVLFFVAGKVLEQRRYKAFEAEAASMDRILLEGESVHDLTEPVKALATWRTYWKDGDMDGLVNMFSTDFLARLTKRKTKSQIISEYVRLFKSGSLSNSAAIASGFNNPEIVRVPRKPWSQGDLALFRSDYINLAQDEPPGHRYILALSWDAQNSLWRYAELREAEFFNIKWERETFIMQKQVGGMAVKYDEKGNEIIDRNTE